jgi:hypothetical protein
MSSLDPRPAGAGAGGRSFAERFTAYFDRDVAQKAAKSISDGAEMEFRVTGPTPETFTFTKTGGKNALKPGAASDAQLAFELTPQAAEDILADKTDSIGAIGVNIAKLVVSKDEARKVKVEFKAGFLTLFAKGYLGVLTAGGSEFASFLASRGLSGMGAIKTALKKMRS